MGICRIKAKPLCSLNKSCLFLFAKNIDTRDEASGAIVESSLQPLLKKKNDKREIKSCFKAVINKNKRLG